MGFKMVNVMKSPILALLTLFCFSLSIFAQSENRNDTLNVSFLPSDNYLSNRFKETADGYIISFKPIELMHNSISTSLASSNFQFLKPQLNFSNSFKSYSSPNDKQYFLLTTANIDYLNFNESWHLLNLTSTTYRLNNGSKITTYGLYNNLSYPFSQPSMIMRNQNQFVGGLEFRSANGKFGINIQVQRRSAFPFSPFY